MLRFEVARCASCSLLRTLPPPDESRYSRGESIWAHHDAPDTWSQGLARRLIELAPGDRLLDVGCSVGNVVAAATRLGARAEGIDLDPVAIARGRSLGHDVHERDIAEQGGQWDGINLNHVLEHVSDLEGFLGHIGRLTAPGGVVTIQVPYCRGLVPRLMGDNWFAWAPDEHVWQFEPSSLVRVVETLSPLRKVQVRGRGRIEPPSSGIKGAVKRQLAAVGSAVGQGDQLEAVFRRP
jgi:SAM-dependent methyltransferase